MERTAEQGGEVRQAAVSAPVKCEKKQEEEPVYSVNELEEARRSIASTLVKCEKALEKLTPGKSQHTLTARRIAAFRIALDLIERALEDRGEP